MKKLMVLVLFALVSTACGTAVYEHRFEVAVNDPQNRLGPPPVDVSIFDSSMGRSEEWARKTIGRSSPGQPYIGQTSSTAAKMVYDSSLPASVTAGLFLPGLEKAGFFMLSVATADGPERATTLKYASFNVPTAEEDKIQPLTARFSSVPAKKGWTIRLTVDVPAAEKRQ